MDPQAESRPASPQSQLWGGGDHTRSHTQECHTQSLILRVSYTESHTQSLILRVSYTESHTQSFILRVSYSDLLIPHVNTGMHEMGLSTRV